MDTTDDTLLGGRVRVRQPRKGYRVGLEAPLLAAFGLEEPRKPPRHVVDLGAGVGSVGLCASYFSPKTRVSLVEDEPETARLAAHNVVDNGLAERAAVIPASVADAVEVLGKGVADLVLTNPPWFDEDAGFVPTDERRRRARTLGAAGVTPFLVTGRQLLARGGRLAIAFPAPSLVALLGSLAIAGLVPKRMRFLHGRATANADVVFVEAMPAKPGGLRIYPPWSVRTATEAYAPDIAAILQGEWAPPAKIRQPRRQDDLRGGRGRLQRPPRFRPVG